MDSSAAILALAPFGSVFPGGPCDLPRSRGGIALVRMLPAGDDGPSITRHRDCVAVSPTGAAG